MRNSIDIYLYIALVARTMISCFMVTARGSLERIVLTGEEIKDQVDLSTELIDKQTTSFISVRVIPMEKSNLICLVLVVTYEKNVAIRKQNGRRLIRGYIKA